MDSDTIDELLQLAVVGLLGLGFILLSRIAGQHAAAITDLQETVRMHVHEQQIGVIPND